MNPLEHARLSVYKHGGTISDYLEIHAFLDSTKEFYYHAKHRIILHNSTLGVCAVVKKFGLLTPNGILVREIVYDHIREDLSNKLPTLYQWYKALYYQKDGENIPLTTVMSYQAFMSNIVESDFGKRAGLSNTDKHIIEELLEKLVLTEPWMFTPNRNDITLLQKIKHDSVVKN